MPGYRRVRMGTILVALQLSACVASGAPLVLALPPVLPIMHVTGGLSSGADGSGAGYAP